MPSVSQKQASFNSGGRDINVDCFLPHARDQRHPTVIGLHGFSGGHAAMAEPAVLLAERGFAVYVLHYFDRSGNVEPSKNSLIRHFPLWMKTLWDATSYVVGQREVDPERIALVGFSLGAYIALCNAAIDFRVRVVVEFFGGFPKEMKFFMRRLCPVLILHGENDQTVPVQEAYHLQHLLEQKGIEHEMQIYPGVGHGFNGDTRRDAMLRALAFLERHLSPTQLVP